MKKNQLTPDIFVIEDFLSSSECTEYIAKSEEIGYKEATVTTLEGQKMIKGIRNNTRVIQVNQTLADLLWNKIEPFVDTLEDGSFPIGVNE